MTPYDVILIDPIVTGRSNDVLKRLHVVERSNANIILFPHWHDRVMDFYRTDDIRHAVMSFIEE